MSLTPAGWSAPRHSFSRLSELALLLGYTPARMFPLRDTIPSLRRPVVTFTIVVLCGVVFLFELMLGRELQGFLQRWAFVPAHLFYPEAFDTSLLATLRAALFSMFLHGGWLHIIGNMWFLWVFGDNVEDALGHAGFLVFYLTTGLAATLAQAVIEPSSTVPMVGASGAIAGVLGAYFVWFPWARVKTFVFLGFFFTLAELPAPLFLLMWFVIQFFSGTLSLVAASSGGGVAFFAHLGGFVAGLAGAIWLRRQGLVRPRPRNRFFWE